jgi:DNA-binding response OmpR family regulator
MVGILSERLASGHRPVRDMRYEVRRPTADDRRAAARRTDPPPSDRQSRRVDRLHGVLDRPPVDAEPWSDEELQEPERQESQLQGAQFQDDGDEAAAHPSSIRAVAVLPVEAAAEIRGREVDGRLVDRLRRGRDFDLVLLDLQTVERLNLLLVRDLQRLTDDTVVLLVNNGGSDLAQLQTVLAGTLGVTQAEQEPPAPSAIERGFLRLDPRSNQVTWKDELVPLTIAEFNIVTLFATRIGDAICYRDIYDVVHGAGFHAGDGDTGYHTNVRSLVKRIRKKFLAVDPEFAEIENHRAFGYRWRTSPRMPAVRRRPRGDGTL